MAKVLGIGGIFFKSPDPKRLHEWYAKWLGIEFEDLGTAFFPKVMPANVRTVWSSILSTRNDFEPYARDFVFNLIVDNLEEALDQVKEGGAEIVSEAAKHEYGLTAWFIDPGGHKVELWETIKGES